MAATRPFLVILPGGSQNPTHYGYLSHLLQLAGYPTYSALLPSVGASEEITPGDDAKYIRDKVIRPILDHEEHDVILIMHSYSGVPGSAAALGLGKAERTAQGKKAGVLGQIFIASLLQKGDAGLSISAAFGGQFPPHLRVDPDANVVRCDDRIPPLYNDVAPDLADVVAVMAMAQGLTSFTGLCPRASWDHDDYKGRIAYIRTVNDTGVPVVVQQMLIDGTGVDWIIKDIDSGHSPQLSQPEKLTTMLLELVKIFETL